MNKNILIIILVAVVAAAGIGAAAVMMTSGGGSTEEGDAYSVTLQVDQGDGTYKAYSAEGSTVAGILESSLGDDIELKSNGNVLSYKGKANAGDESWIVFRWQSLNGWIPAKDSDVHDGTTLVLEYAKKIVKGGKTEYEQPGFSVVSEAYFFVQIPSMSEIEKNARDPSSKADDKSEGAKLTTSERFDILMGWLEKAGLDIPTMEAGIWIKGEGTNVNEALADAVQKCLFPSCAIEAEEVKGEMVYRLDGEDFHSHLTSTDMFGWFTGFFGWKDTQLKNRDWTYWSQFSYSPNAKTLDDTRQWTYNSLTLGKYDMSRYHYFALVLQTTSEKQADDGVEMVMPTPADIPKELLR